MTVAVRVIPCLDVANGRVVKGVSFESLRDAGDPVEAAVRYEAEGADELTFLDIAAAHEKRGTLVEVASPCGRACFRSRSPWEAACGPWRTRTRFSAREPTG